MDKHYYELTVNVKAGYEELVGDFIMSAADVGVEFGKSALIVRSEEDLNSVKEALIGLRKELGGDIIGDIVLATKANEDWIANYKASVTPIEAGRFYVRPGWYAPKEGCIDIRIDPALAFGSGHHATTYTCLETIDTYVRKDLEVLDVGTGSGILAIASAKKGAVVDLCDTDTLAVTSAKENFALNNATYRNVWVGSIDQAPQAYDVIIANIIVDILKPLAPALIRHLKPKGILILSGILANKASVLDTSYKSLELIEQKQRDEWVTRVYRKDA